MNLHVPYRKSAPLSHREKQAAQKQHYPILAASSADMCNLTEKQLQHNPAGRCKNMSTAYSTIVSVQKC